MEGIVPAVSDSLHHLVRRFCTKATSGISDITVQAHTETQIRSVQGQLFCNKRVFNPNFIPFSAVSQQPREGPSCAQKYLKY